MIAWRDVSVSRLLSTCVLLLPLLASAGPAAALLNKAGPPEGPAAAGEVKDVASLESALHSLPAEGGTILLSPGVYRLERTLNLSGKSPVRLEGSTANDSRARLVVAAPLINAITARNSEHIAVSNLDFEGSGTAQTFDTGSAIFFENSNNIEIAGNSFQNFSGPVVYIKAINPEGSRHIRVHDNQFSNNRQTSLIDAADIYIGGAGGPHNYPVEDVEILGNKCLSTGAGNQNYHGIILFQNVRNARIEDNQVENKFWHGIVLTNEVVTAPDQPVDRDVVIQENRVRGCGRVGIYVQDSDRVTVSSNSTEGNGTHAVSGIEGGIFVNQARFPGAVDVLRNVLSSELWEGIKVVATQLPGSRQGGTVTIRENRIFHSDRDGGVAAIAVTSNPSPPGLIKSVTIPWPGMNPLLAERYRVSP